MKIFETAGLLVRKNQPVSKDPWIYLLKIQISDTVGGITDYAYLTNNNEEIFYPTAPASAVKTWSPFPFTMDMPTASSNGSIPTWTLTIDNTNRIIDYFVQQYQGLQNKEVEMTIGTVDVDVVPDSWDGIERPKYNFVFEESNKSKLLITGASITDQQIQFTLSMPSLFTRRFPSRKYTKYYCIWDYKGVECAYTGSELTCKRTWDDCLNNHNASGTYSSSSVGNSTRFGGKPELETI